MSHTFSPTAAPNSPPIENPDDKAPPQLLDRLAEILPPNALLVGDAIDARYMEDRRGRFSARPRFVLRPASTGEVADCLAACNGFHQPVVVHGGRTGLSGGHRVEASEAVLSTERLTSQCEIDADMATVLASAGLSLQTVQDAAEGRGFLFGVDIGARGSATIGGNIATNAGGIRVLRYGMFRAQVAGLETVLADGTVLSSLRGLYKDNAGYDLSQLFIGSEGTIGVVTRARLRLHPRPVNETNAFLAVPSISAAISLLRHLRRRLGSAVSAFELITPQSYEGALSFLAMNSPLRSAAPFYLLTEVQSFSPEGAQDAFTQALMQAIEEGLASDAVVSQSSREFQSLWKMRDACAEHLRDLDHIMGGDISVPLHKMEWFVEQARSDVLSVDPQAQLFVFGHLGDGNLHYVIGSPKAHEAMNRVYNRVAEAEGSIAAEHGIGFDKKPWLHLSRGPAEIETMQRLKRALDPNAILNRGRVFDSR